MSELAKGSFCLEGHIDVPADRLDEVRKALKDHIRLTRQEPDCIYFNVAPCPDIGGRFLVSEAFVDEVVFKYHQTRAGNSPWAEASKNVPRDYNVWVVE